MFKTPFNAGNFPAIPEKNSGEILIEKAGYISAEKRITNLMLAGQRLVESRKAQYDFPDGKIDETFSDPTRRKGYDPADATQDQLQIINRVQESVQKNVNVEETPGIMPGSESKSPE